jgi:hypothetical protein
MAKHADEPQGRRDRLSLGRRHDIVDEILVRQAPTEQPAPDVFVKKTYKIRTETVERVRLAADVQGVGIGELVDWALANVLDQLEAGTLQVPVEQVQVSMSVVAGRPVGRPSLRQLARAHVQRPDGTGNE